MKLTLRLLYKKKLRVFKPNDKYLIMLLKEIMLLKCFLKKFNINILGIAVMVLCLPLQIHIKVYIVIIILLHLKKCFVVFICISSFVIFLGEHSSGCAHWLVDWLVCS